MARLQVQNDFLDYEGFVEKFKPKKTTDDCYTPQGFYDALVGWLRLNVPAFAEATEILRPFWPGGDYRKADYPDGCMVVDNPPFSILAQIVDDYLRSGVKFWLFAPTLTLFNYCSRKGVTAVLTGVTCTYENGAQVNTSFITNAWPKDSAAAVCGTLYKVLDAENKERTGELKKKTKTVIHNDHVTSAALLHKVCKGGFDLELPRAQTFHVRRMDNGVTIFGSGLILSDQLAAELRAAELRAAERVNLSQNELRIIEQLTKNGNELEKDED